MLKFFPKILIIFFLATFIVQLFCLILLLALPQTGQASEIALTSPTEIQAKNMQFAPQVPIPGFTFDPKAGSTKNIANLVMAIYNYGIGIIGILAAVVLMIGGVLWIVAGGNATQIGEAKAWIGAALTGLILALTSYLILNTINPALVNLEITQIPGVSKMKATTITGFDNAAAQGKINELKQTYSNNITLPSSINLVGMKPNVAEGIAEVKKACNAFYGAIGCKITITGGTEKDPSGNSFIVGDFPTGIDNSTLGEIIFNRTNPNITKVNADKNEACLTATGGTTYKLKRLPSNGGIMVTVDPSC